MYESILEDLTMVLQTNVNAGHKAKYDLDGTALSLQYSFARPATVTSATTSRALNSIQGQHRGRERLAGLHLGCTHCYTVYRFLVHFFVEGPWTCVGLRGILGLGV
jgi:hypothetical protein